MTELASWRITVSLFLVEGLRALARHKLRTALTGLGIAIGVAAVVLVVAFSDAATARIDRDFQALGDNLVWLEAGSRNVHGVRTGSHGTTSLTIEDAEAIRREVPLITRLSPQVDGNVQVVRAGHNWSTRYRGETPDYVAIKYWSVETGAMFTDQDVEAGAHRVLLGHTVATELFGSDDPVGKDVRMNGQVFEVIGVLAPKGQSGSGSDQDDWVLLPYTTAEQTLRGGGYTWLDDVVCSARSAADVAPAREAIIALMRQRHHIAPGDEDDFNIRRPDEVINAQRASSETMALLLVGIAGLSLLLGGVGVMNVMRASVTQRTREIGLRVAVGATPAAIQMQFLGESIALSLLGGTAGVLMSLLVSTMAVRYASAELALSVRAALFALGCSTTVGVVFGLYPARRAAHLDPIEALRQE